MAKPPRRVYWDSCCWIALIQKEKIRGADDVVTEDREAMCRVIIEAAKKGAVEIVTSALSLTEVCKQPDGGGDPLESFFENDYILLINMDKSVGERGRALMNAGHAGLKPPDATHIASALLTPGVEEMHTFDVRLLGLAGQIIRPDGEPLKICKPQPGGPAVPLLEAMMPQVANGDAVAP